MAGLAEASDANYYYVKDTEKLSEIFAKELGEMMSVAARKFESKSPVQRASRHSVLLLDRRNLRDRKPRYN
jgi:hypothetical protein